MLFPTVSYGIFFLVVLVIAWALAHRPEWHKNFLLLASYCFYGFWNWSYVPLLFAVSLGSALIARQIQNAVGPKRKRWLILGVTLNLSTLAYYKYTSFALLSLLNLWSLIAPAPMISFNSPLLPLGISFFVFHAISLLADTYRQKLRIKINLRDALLYIAFFPQLIAGPILRASSFLPQLALPRDPRIIRANTACLLIISGLFKKIIIANILATRLVEPVFAAPSRFSGADTLLAVYGYAAQIYCDFSGYTDIAIGCALLLGYRFPRNFNAPYTAVSPQDFWHRWNISLSTWLRDYLYIPLGGSRAGEASTLRNLMITMVLGGLWHGANWTFVFWGALWGTLLVIHRLWLRLQSKPIQALRASLAWRWMSRLMLFQAVCLGWIFFRAPSFHIGLEILHRLTAPGPASLATMPVVVVLILGLFGQYLPRRWRFGLEIEIARWPAALRGAGLAVALFIISVLGPTGVAPFIYFQF
ncbi:alginate O-acetyltransferase complex protein AlgI [Acidiphilium sp. MT5]|jgi:D-alanyl-lipoteichoic acid acyltransferase DltB (MBOAT superfamily)